jgi:hypothetical protein
VWENLGDDNTGRKKLKIKIVTLKPHGTKQPIHTAQPLRANASCTTTATYPASSRSAARARYADFHCQRIRVTHNARTVCGGLQDVVGSGSTGEGLDSPS